jgi:alkylhydroperoxidase family enzyme
MERMFLSGVEAQAKESPAGQELAAAEKAGAEIPQILYLFAFKPELTSHLAAFTHELMRGKSDLSPGVRELIAAYTSSKNRCLF